MEHRELAEYKIILCDDNQLYIERLREEISAINFKNKNYRLSITGVSSSQLFIENIRSGEYDVIILDICMKSDSNGQVVFDYIRSRLQQDYYGPDLYTQAKRYCPNALFFVLSNLPVGKSRTIFNNVDAQYYCKEKTTPADIANYIKNYFDSERKRLLNNVFVVYGHDEDLRNSVVKYIRRIKINTIDLMAHSASGIRTIFDALNSCANSVECAIVLLSADDRVVNDRHEFLAYRARQNVIFEMGFFAGVLGRDKVIVIYKPDDKFEFPSDILGIYYIAYSEDGKWKQELKSHLQKIGFHLE